MIKQTVVDTFIILMVVMVLQIYAYSRTYQIVHFKYVQFMHDNYIIKVDIIISVRLLKK